MTWHAIILCEGAHDQATIASLAATIDGWERVTAIPKELPTDLDKTYPKPQQNKWGATEFDRPPDYLRRSDRWAEVRQMGGINRLLSRNATDLLKRTSASAVAVIVDANGVGVASRTESFKNVFRDLYSHADEVKPGTICVGDPRLGLWVAPDNNRNGTLMDVLLDAASLEKPKLTKTGERFVASLDKVEPGAWSTHRSKAVLGAISQTIKPGASLAVALAARNWLPGTVSHDGAAFKNLKSFLMDLTSS